MKKILLYLIVFCALSASSQTVLMQESVDSVYYKRKFGVNSIHFVHPYFTFGFLFDTGNNKDVTDFGSTNSFSFGVRYKLRLTNHFATGIELEDRISTIAFPVHNPVLKDKYIFFDIKYAWYFRTNLGMRGDIMGKFFDFGIYGSSIFFPTHFIKKNVDNQHYSSVSYYEEDLDYFDSFNYGLILRFGINQFVIFSEYRLNNIIKEKYSEQFRSTPQVTVGLQIGLHR